MNYSPFLYSIFYVVLQYLLKFYYAEERNAEEAEEAAEPEVLLEFLAHGPVVAGAVVVARNRGEALEDHPTS